MQSASVAQSWGGSQSRTRPILRSHFRCPTRTRRGLGQCCWHPMRHSPIGRQNEKRQTSASAPKSQIGYADIPDTPRSEMETVPTCPSKQVKVTRSRPVAGTWRPTTTTNASTAKVARTSGGYCRIARRFKQPAAFAETTGRRAGCSGASRMRSRGARRREGALRADQRRVIHAAHSDVERLKIAPRHPPQFLR
jgi:hypothetical protein